MNEISVNRLYELYYDAIERCTSKTVSFSDEEIEYNLYEEFDVGAISFLHDKSLVNLFAAGLINEEAVSISQKIRKTWFELQKNNWTTEEIRNETAWKHLFLMCDELLTLLPLPPHRNQP